MTDDEFRRFLSQMGEELYRDMPWRADTRPYYVLVSELMLQQTQVDRVIPKFAAFVEAFPDERSLAAASLADVLRLWQGLGYNRRAKFLHEAAKRIVELGAFPTDETGLLALPGAIMAYAYDKPSVYIETNVRAVFIHHFFGDTELVDDKDIRDVLARVLDRDEPRRFYWALMDYGSYLKKQGVAPGRSAQYKKQSRLKGSVREVRGQIIAALAEEDRSEPSLMAAVRADERFAAALAGLVKDGLVRETDGVLHLTK